MATKKLESLFEGMFRTEEEIKLIRIHKEAYLKNDPPERIIGPSGGEFRFEINKALHEIHIRLEKLEI